MADTNINDPSLATNVIANTDLILVVREPNTDPSTNTITVQAFVAQVANALLITQETPANSTITIGSGMILYDNSYIYIATSNNVLRRVATSSF